MNRIVDNFIGDIKYDPEYRFDLKVSRVSNTIKIKITPNKIQTKN